MRKKTQPRTRLIDIYYVTDGFDNPKDPDDYSISDYILSLEQFFEDSNYHSLVYIPEALSTVVQSARLSPLEQNRLMADLAETIFQNIK